MTPTLSGVGPSKALQCRDGLLGGLIMGLASVWNQPSELEALWSSASANVPVCLVLGGIIGILLPRPKWLEASGKSGALLYITPPGLFLRRAALFFHGAYIVREMWNYFTLPPASGNMWTAFKEVFFGWWAALRNALQGRGFTLPSKSDEERVQLSGHAVHHHHHHHHHRRRRHHEHPKEETLHWYVNEADLKLFKDKIEKEEQPSDVGLWEPMMDKDFGNFTYTAWRRKLPDGKTDYKSVTVASNATAEEFIDFYFDDIVRMKWDPMISQVDVVENGPSNHRCQVVHWIRQFPFAFINRRDYVIARRLYKENGCLYGITKGIEHPRAPPRSDIVRMDTFYSMWRSRSIPDPKGGSEPACETVLLHREDFKIPENMARFAVKHGMAGFVKKLGPEVQNFVAERRQRCQPFEHDPEAFGVNTVPNPPTDFERESASSEVDDSASEASCESSRPSSLHRRTRPVPNKMRQQLRRAVLLAAATASIVTLAKRK